MNDSQTIILPTTVPLVASLNQGAGAILGLTIYNNSNGSVSVFVGTQSPGSSPDFICPAGAY